MIHKPLARNSKDERRDCSLWLSRIAVRAVSRVYDGTVISEDEATLLAGQLHKRIDHIERALEGEFLLGDHFLIADISVYPRVAMYPIVGLPIDPAKCPRMNRWTAAIANRPSIKRSERVLPRENSALNASLQSARHQVYVLCLPARALM
jgi:glutathione S-transferase